MFRILIIGTRSEVRAFERKLQELTVSGSSYLTYFEPLSYSNLALNHS